MPNNSIARKIYELPGFQKEYNKLLLRSVSQQFQKLEVTKWKRI